MALTDIGFQKTPARPVEITFAAQGGLPNPNQTLALIGHMGATGGATGGAPTASGYATPYVPIVINNVTDPTAGGLEAQLKFGVGSELAEMVVAAIQANFAEGNSNFPAITCVPLASTDVDFGPVNAGNIPAALAACDKFEAEFVVSPYDGANQTLTNQLKTQAQSMSGATRVQNGQYGTFGVAFNRSVADPSTLFKYDTQYLTLAWLRDTATGPSAPEYSIAEMAAAYAGILGGIPVPFNPVDNNVIGDVLAPAQQSDWITVGAGLESESALTQGWTPLRVLPNGSVAIVRSVTARVTVGDGVTAVTAYYDVQDFMVLYFFRKAVAARFNQTDFTNQKASGAEANLARSEIIRLASAFEDQGMFQNVSGLSPQVVVQTNASDRSRFDVFIPVNVVPGLHVIATNVQATTVGDVFTV